MVVGMACCEEKEEADSASGVWTAADMQWINPQDWKKENAWKLLMWYHIQCGDPELKKMNMERDEEKDIHPCRTGKK